MTHAGQLIDATSAFLRAKHPEQVRVIDKDAGTGRWEPTDAQKALLVRLETAATTAQAVRCKADLVAEMNAILLSLGLDADERQAALHGLWPDQLRARDAYIEKHWDGVGDPIGWWLSQAEEIDFD